MQARFHVHRSQLRRPMSTLRPWPVGTITSAQTTTLTNSVSFDWFSEDNSAKSQRLFWKIMTGLQSKLSSRLTFTGHVGDSLRQFLSKWLACNRSYRPDHFSRRLEPAMAGLAMSH